MAYATTNPYTNETLATFPGIEDEELDRAVHTAQRTFESWRTKSFDERKEVVARAASILRERPDEFARLLTLEMGKLYSESLGEVDLAASILDYYADNAEEFLAPERVSTDHSEAGEAIVVSDPIGVLFGVQPWNFPYYQLARFAGPNLMAGNVVMVKHASIVPQSAAAFERLFREAGAPEGAYTNVYASKDQVSRTIQDSRIRGVALTGSEGAGSSVAAHAGEELKKSTLELGGSDALIVLADADLDAAVEAIVHGAYGQSGQRCSATSRVIVDRAVHEELMARLIPRVESMVIGPGSQPDADIGPVVNDERHRACLDAIEGAVAAGATVAAGGGAVELDQPGYYIRATLLDDVAWDSELAQEEVFGPVLSVITCDGYEDAMRISNSVKYGMSGTIFTQDPALMFQALQDFEAGMLHVNRPGVGAYSHLPHMGAKASQLGAPECSPEVWNFYTDLRSACIRY